MKFQVFDDDHLSLTYFLSFLAFNNIEAELFDPQTPSALIITLSFKCFKSLKNILKASIKQNPTSCEVKNITILNIFEVGSLDVQTVDHEQQQIMFTSAIPMLVKLCQQDDWNISLTSVIDRKLISEEILYKARLEDRLEDGQDGQN